jgi:hypothetical protein
MRRQAIIYWDTTIKLIAAYFQTRDLKGWKLEGWRRRRINSTDHHGDRVITGQSSTFLVRMFDFFRIVLETVAG